MQIQKETGEMEEFDEAKLCGSIRDAGAPKDLADQVCEAVKNKDKKGTTTSTIFRMALNFLVEDDVRLPARYSIKRGLAALGPAGFAFEHYLSALLSVYGYE